MYEGKDKDKEPCVGEKICPLGAQFCLLQIYFSYGM